MHEQPPMMKQVSEEKKGQFTPTHHEPLVEVSNKPQKKL